MIFGIKSDTNTKKNLNNSLTENPQKIHEEEDKKNESKISKEVTPKNLVTDNDDYIEDDFLKSSITPKTDEITPKIDEISIKS